jgi:hypothetical protein
MNAVLEQLRRGPRTTGELALVTGLSRNAVECAIRAAGSAGHDIRNARGAGDRRGALYVLVLDAEHPGERRCHICGCILSDSNLTPFCRHHLPLAALIALLEAELAGERETAEQMALVV